MSCLNEERVQAVADGHATEAEFDHLGACPSCRARAADVRAALDAFAARMADIPVPPRLRARVLSPSGATTLRPAPPVFRPRPAWLVAGGAVAALVAALVFVVFPGVDRGTPLSAAEILNRSLLTLQGTGVEHLEYELTLQTSGATTSHAALALDGGLYRIDQLIDHGSGRWRLARFAPDGTLLNGIAEDPGRGTREALLRVDGRLFRLQFAVDESDRVPLWTLQRRVAEAMIRLVQASGGQVVSEQVVGARRAFVVDLPATAVSGSSLMFDLTRARIVVDATDFNVLEFSLSGAMLGEPMAVEFRLLQRTVSAGVSDPRAFELPPTPSAIAVAGDGTTDIGADVISLLLREIARAHP